eukprot:606515-Pyramimonas_sp.AAC.1
MFRNHVLWYVCLDTRCSKYVYETACFLTDVGIRARRRARTSSPVFIVAQGRSHNFRRFAYPHQPVQKRRPGE